MAARTAQLAETNQSLARLAAIVASSNDAIVSLDLDSVITSWNPAAERMYGYRSGEILGCPVAMLTLADVSGELSKVIERVKNGEHVSSFEATRVRKTGQRFNVHVTLSPVKDDAGKTRGISMISRDITERDRTQEMLRLTVEAAPNAMVMADDRGKIVLVNSQTEKLFGYRREELIGQDVEILVPHKYRGHHPEHRAEFMDDPRARAMGAGRDLSGLRKDGSEFPIEIGLNPIATDQGVWVLSAIVDITERRRADEMLRLAVDAAPNAMVIVDEQGKIVLVNSQTEKLFGYGREELFGQQVDMLVPRK